MCSMESTIKGLGVSVGFEVIFHIWCFLVIPNVNLKGRTSKMFEDFVTAQL